MCVPLHFTTWGTLKSIAREMGAEPRTVSLSGRDHDPVRAGAHQQAQNGLHRRRRAVGEKNVLRPGRVPVALADTYGWSAVGVAGFMAGFAATLVVTALIMPRVAQAYGRAHRIALGRATR